MGEFLIFLRILIFIFLCKFSLAITNTTKYSIRTKEKEILDRILSPERYDSRIRPPFNSSDKDGPVIVHVNMFIRSIYDIDDINMEYNLQITFRELWIDDRLKFDDEEGANIVRYLTLTDPSKIWMPDLFFSNEKSGNYHNIMAPNKYLRIFPNGSVLYSVRITLKLSCPMNLVLMPFDRQVCTVRMASYGYTTDDIIFIWKEHDPVSVVQNLHLPRFTLQTFMTDYCNSKTSTGEYSCIKIDFLIRRELSYYLIQVFIPCSMLIILSWLSFWIDQNAVAARLLLGTVTLLTMSYHVARINTMLPQTSYTKAIDIWTGTSLTFVFATIFEFVTVHYLSCKEHCRRIEGKQSKDIEDDTEQNGSAATKAVESRSTADIAVIEKSNDDSENKRRPLSRARIIYKNLLSRTPKSKSKKIDVFARVLFPLLFTLFIFSYWLKYKTTISND